MCNQWIKKSDRRPETPNRDISEFPLYSDVVLFSDGKDIYIGTMRFLPKGSIACDRIAPEDAYYWYADNVHYCSNKSDKSIILWAPLPELPREELTVNFVFEGSKYQVKLEAIAEDENMVALPDGRILRIDPSRYVQYPKQILHGSINIGGQIPIAKEME